MLNAVKGEILRAKSALRMTGTSGSFGTTILFIMSGTSRFVILSRCEGSRP
jgi:hypothetical protein